MIKRTLFFGNPAYLSLKNAQLVIRLNDAQTQEEVTKTVPIEDIGVVVLEDRQITITNGAMDALLQNNCAVVTCDEKHMPAGLLLPLEGHTVQSERFRWQIEASLPLKKQLWQQTVQAKIRNQASVLKRLSGAEVGCMIAWANDVKSGDSENLEGRAAAYYWKSVFPEMERFVRDREGEAPNNLLNYGYAIVYRPYVDELVIEILRSGVDCSELTTDLKRKLLGLPVKEVVIDGRRSPLMVASSQTTASLAKCFGGELRKVVYPVMEI